LKAQNAQLLEENSFIKARLNAELKERHMLDARNQELNRKFMESRKALQATGEMLLKVHNQVTEMRSKSEEREVQLQGALELNKNLTAKLVDMEGRMEGVQSNSSVSSTTVLALKKMVSDKEEHIKGLEEQQLQIQAQVSKLRRENYRLSELTTEQQDDLDSKERKIITLEKKASTLVEVLSQLQISAAESMIKQQQQLQPPATEKPSNFQSPRKNVKPSSKYEESNEGEDDSLFSTRSVVHVQSLPNVDLDKQQQAEKKQPDGRLTVREEPATSASTGSADRTTRNGILRKTTLSAGSSAVVGQENWKDVLRTITTPPATPQTGAKATTPSTRPNTAKEAKVETPSSQLPAEQVKQITEIKKDSAEQQPIKTPTSTDVPPTSAVMSATPSKESESALARARLKTIALVGSAQRRNVQSMIQLDKPLTGTGTASMSPASANGVFPSILSNMESAAMICERYKAPTWDSAFQRVDGEDEEAYKDKLTKLKRSLKKDVVTWTKLFQIEFNAVPTKDDRKKYGFDMFRVYGNLSKALKESGLGEA